MLAGVNVAAEGIRGTATPIVHPDKLLFYTAMARGAEWGEDIPEMLRNENWNYTIFTTDKQHRAGTNQALCLGCHKPLDNTNYLFTLKQLAGAK